MQDLGSTISGDYCTMGYRFDDVDPLIMVPRTYFFNPVIAAKAYRTLNSS